MVSIIAVFWLIIFLSLAARPTILCREAALAAAVGTGVFILAATEALGFFGLLTPSMILAAWAVATAMIAALMRKRLPHGWNRVLATLRAVNQRVDYALAGLIALLAAGALASGLLYPPTNWDSLTYHMARVFFWLQNQSVGHFPTAETRQLFSSPHSDYIALHLTATSPISGRMAGLTQWWAYVLLPCAVTLITRELQGSKMAQRLAAVGAATLPMAILQASTTQNDLNTALWCSVFVLGVLVITRELKEQNRSAAFWPLTAGAAAALAVLTKPTAIIVLAPFGFWLLAALLRHMRAGTSARTLAYMASCFLLLVAPWHTRNAVALDGDLLALNAPGNSHILVTDRSAGGLLSNSLRNASLLPAPPHEGVNQRMGQLVEVSAKALGSGAEDEGVYGPFWIPHMIWNHDYASAPLHIILVLLSLLATLRNRHNMPQTRKSYMQASLLGLFLLLALIEWQPWINRLVLPSLILLMPFMGAALHPPSIGREGNRTAAGALTSILIAASVVLALLVLGFNGTNPLFPRQTITAWTTSYDGLRFRPYPQLADSVRLLREATQEHSVRTLGVRQHEIDFPIYLITSGIPGPDIHYVGDNVWPPTPTESVAPQAIIEIVRASEFDPLRVPLPGSPELLVPPQQSGDWVIWMYKTP